MEHSSALRARDRTIDFLQLIDRYLYVELITFKVCRVESAEYTRPNLQFRNFPSNISIS